MVRARIAVWELVDPSFVTKERTKDLSNCTVSDGAKSSANKMTGSVELIPPATTPDNTFTTRLEISLMSAALPLMYSSSIAANI